MDLACGPNGGAPTAKAIQRSLGARATLREGAENLANLGVFELIIRASRIYVGFDPVLGDHHSMEKADDRSKSRERKSRGIALAYFSDRRRAGDFAHVFCAGDPATE